MSFVPYTLLLALIMVESGGRNNALGPVGEVGCLQITEIMRRDVKRISGRTVTADDCKSRVVSIEVAMIYLSHYVTAERLGREPTLRDYALVWHYGPRGWRRHGDDPYWEKVKQVLP